MAKRLNSSAVLSLAAPLLLLSTLPAAAPLHAAGVGGDDAGASISFKKQIQPIFDANCVACHQSGSAQEGLVLEEGKAYANLIRKPSHQANMALISPGSPQESYLLHKVGGSQASAHGRGERMPLGGKLDPQELDLLRAWVAAGAENN